MNFSTVFGILFGLIIFVVAIVTSAPIEAVLKNWHAFVIVFGSTLAAAMISFPVKSLTNMIKIFFKKIIGKNGQVKSDLINEFVELSKGLKNDPQYLKSKVNQIKNYFLKEAIELVVQGGLTPTEIDEILKKRSNTYSKRYHEEAGYFKTIAKFPPAFGLLGTVLGMIGLMQALGTPDSFKLIGPAMSTGLGATLFGIALANLVFIPFGENLTKLNKDEEVLRDIVMDGVKLLRKGAHPIVVEEHLKSFLMPSERSGVKKAA